MPWGSFDQVGTDAALEFMGRNPAPAPERKASTWSQAVELFEAPFKGAAQGVGQTARAINRVNPMQAGSSGVLSPSEQDDMLQDAGIDRDSQDKALRRGIDAFKPDPLTSTTASMILQDASRLLTKVAGYGLTGGPVAAVVGTGLDEAATGFMEMRDKGVDTATAMQTGAVRGVATAVGVAIPVAGGTALQTAGLIAAGGPLSYIGEQAATRAILENANYPELAAEHDPWDPVGLGVSLAVPGIFGTVLHRARVRKAAAEAAGKPAPSEMPAGFADTPEIRDAAHVAYRDQQAQGAALGDRADPRTQAAHAKALQETQRAMDSGELVRLDAVPMQLDEARVKQVVADMGERLRRVDEEIRASRSADDLAPIEVEPAPLATVAPVLDDGLDRLAADAMRLIDTQQIDDLPPAVGNLLIGLRENGGNVGELVQRVRDVRATGGGDGDIANQIADAVEQARTIAAQPPAVRSAMEAIRQRPDMPVRLDDNAPAQGARDALEAVSQERARANVESRAFEAAVECMLEG